MKIVYLIANVEDIAGGTRVLFEHVNRFLSRGHEVEVWTTAKGGVPYFATSVPIKFMDSQSVAEPEVLVLTDPCFLPKVFPNRTVGKTFLLVQHDNEWVSEITGSVTYSKLLKDYQDFFLGNKCQLVTVSVWLKGVLESKYGLPSVVVRNGIDPSQFHPDKPIVEADEPTLLAIFDPQPWKGFSDVANAIVEIRRKVPDMRSMIMGKYLPSMPVIPGKSFGFPFPVTFFNRPIQRDLARIYSAATVFVSASWLEGFGLPGLEAMACGAPVVTTDSGGVREYAVNEETALVVPPKNHQAIADAVLRILNDEKLRLRLTKNGLKKAEDFDWERSIDVLENLFS